MKSILRVFVAFVALASLLFPLTVFPAEKTLELSEGTVKKIDVPSQRVMLAHGSIANIGMMPMTMMFKVKDPAMLKSLKNGQMVRFRVEDLGGEYTVVHIEPTK
jgi:Cu(I)/Ag(I) efflux system protein CusF